MRHTVCGGIGTNYFTTGNDAPVVTATNVLNRPIWSTPGFLGQTSIQSITFGQSTQPANNANPRNVYLRGTVSF